MVTRGPPLRQVLDVDFRELCLYSPVGLLLQSRPGAVRVSLVKVLLRRRGTLRASELGIDYVFHVQPDVTSRAL